MHRVLQIVFALVVVGSLVLHWGETSALELGVGDCFDDNEVYALRTVEGDGWPGVEALDAFARTACYDAFEPFVDRAYETSRLEIGWMVPSETSWTDHDDRVVTCFLYDLEFRKLTGSMEASGV